MSTLKLYEKILEEHLSQKDTSTINEKRCVETYLHKRYDEKKIQRVVDSVKSRHDLNSLLNIQKNRAMLSNVLDPVLTHKIRNTFKKGNKLNLELLSDAYFIVLIKQILESFGYEVLHMPPLKSGAVDFVVYRDNTKIAVFVIRRSLTHSVDMKTLIDTRHTTKSLKCEQTLIFCDSYFEEEACEYAQDYQIHLIDIDKLKILVDDFVRNRKNEEKHYLSTEKKALKDDYFYLEADIRSVRTKVKVKDINYVPDRENNRLMFKGILINSGKRPVDRLKVNLRIYGRDKTVVDTLSEQIGDGRLDNGSEVNFECSFDNISEYQWKNICTYMVKLTYRS